MNKSHHNKILRATKFSVVCEVIAKIIAPITTIVLARLLSQEVFGIVASLTAITSMADMLSDAGFNAYIVQHQFKSELEKKGSLNICFLTNITLAFILFILIELNRNEFSKLVGAEGYGNVLAIMAFVIPMISVSSIEMAIMKKDLDFKSLGIIKIISKIIPFLATIPLAISGLGYWSLVIGTLVGELVGMVLCLIYGKFFPTLYFPIIYIKNIFSFSIWAYLESILEWLIANIAILVLATIYGVGPLGVFKVAINMVNQITSSIYALYSNVYKSAIAKEQFDSEGFRKMFLTFQKYTSLLSIPVGIFVFVYRDLVTDILLGSEWSEASTLIGFYCLTSTISVAFGNFYSDAIRAKGYPSKLVIIDLIYLTFIIGLICYASLIPFALFCITFSIIKIIQPFFQIIIGQKVCDVPFIEVIKSSYPQIIAAIISAILAVIFGFTKLKLLWGISTAILMFFLYFILIYAISPDREFYKELFYKHFVIKLKRNI